MVIYLRFIVWCEGLLQVFHTTGFLIYLWLKPAPVQVVPVKGTGFTGTGVVCQFSTLGLTLLFPSSTVHFWSKDSSVVEGVGEGWGLPTPGVLVGVL
jgi:hypothetical protein